MRDGGGVPLLTYLTLFYTYLSNFLMDTLLLITGVQYACPAGDVDAVMAQMEQEKPEVLLVTEQTDDFGIIVRALVGTAYRGVVSRFDVEHALAMMQHNNDNVLVGHVVSTDSQGRCYTASIAGEYPNLEKEAHSTEESAWNEWQWTNAPLLAERPEESRLQISIKVALKELLSKGSMHTATLLEHLRQILELAQWDVSCETQQQLSRICREVGTHPDEAVRSLQRELQRMLIAFGSARRTQEFQDTYLPLLVQSNEAEIMWQQWKEMHGEALRNPMKWEETLRTAYLHIQDALSRLPAGLCRQQNNFGALMHRLLYLNVPRRKMLMLLSALVLKAKIAALLNMDDDKTADEKEQWQLRVARRLAPIFGGEVATAREFLGMAKDRPGKEITQLVNRWVTDKRILRDLSHRPLWTILHDEGLYKRSESNWNAQLR